MTKSFDEWWSERKKNGFVPTFSDVASNAFKAGQQSKQAEVDGLQLKLSEDSKVLHNVIDIERRKCEELQKRIDVLSKKLNEMAHIFLDDLDEILKGNTNDH